jgi:transcriptional regulator of acetoin/glycerol metabolism
VPAGGEAPPTFRRANAPPPRAEIEAMIRDAGGDVDAAATAAGVERSTFYRWLRENGLSARDFR